MNLQLLRRLGEKLTPYEAFLGSLALTIGAILARRVVSRHIEELTSLDQRLADARKELLQQAAKSMSDAADIIDEHQAADVVDEHQAPPELLPPVDPAATSGPWFDSGE